jgi:hypothetical protein
MGGRGMSSHPNVILMVVFTPDDLPSKTLRDILLDNDADEYDYIKVGGKKYRAILMRDEYDSDIQIGAKENDLVFYDLVTYGYGDKITWQTLSEQQQSLEAWAKAMAEKFHCTYAIEVSANYW